MSRLALSAAGLIGIALATMSGTAQAEDSFTAISWSTGIEYSSGTYGGTEDIEDTYVPLTVRFMTERVGYELTVPYLSVTGPAGTTVLDPADQPVAGSGPTITESGMGDVIAGATLYDVLYSDVLDMALDLTGKIKFGTADSTKGLGTGEHDFTLRADVYKFYELVTLMASTGYKFRGDPADIDLDNVLLASFGGALTLSDETRLGLVYDYRETALAVNDDVAELSAFLSHAWNDTWHIQLYAFSGFSDSSADWGAGILFEIS